MSLSETCIKRPVFASVLSLILILFGVVSYFKLSVSELPSITFPIVTITTQLPGASPEVIDETVTDLIEAELNTIEGIKRIKSKSFDGYSLITAEFTTDCDIDLAAQDCRDRIGRIRRFLPNDIAEPSIEKLDLNAFPVMWVAVSSDALSPVDLSLAAEKNVKERLQKVPGVGSITVGGEKKYAPRVWLNPAKLYAYGLTVNDVMGALAAENTDLPAGRFESFNREFSLKTEQELRSLEALRRLTVTKIGSAPIRLSALGEITEGVEDERSLARYSRRDAVGLGIIKQPSANTIAVANAVKKEIAKINQSSSSQVKIEVAFDSSEFIQKSIDEVKETLWSSTLLVILCIFLFLRNFRSTLIPAVAIPISIISTFAAMHFLGFTLNNFTLLGLVLAIGIVVDDAIVMLENIFRHMEEGKGALEAAIIGSKEMVLPVIAASLTLIAVFIPIAFMQGQVGQFFFEFGLTVSIAIAISAFVSLTLTPVASSRFLRVKDKHGSLYTFIESQYVKLEKGYKKILPFALKKKGWVIAAGFATIALSGFFLMHIGKEFAPEEDRGSFIISLKAPEGSTLSYSEKYLAEIEQILAQNSFVEGFFAALALQGADVPAVNKGLLFVQLKKDPSRPSVHEVIADLRKRLTEVVGVNAWPMTFNPFAHEGQSKPFSFTVASPDYEELKHQTPLFTTALQGIAGLKDVESDLEVNKGQFTLLIDRDRAAELGVSVRDIASSLNILLAGKEGAKFKKEGERYKVMVQLDKAFAGAPQTLENLYVRSQNGSMIRMDQVVKLEEGIGPSTINRRDRKKVVTFSANLEGITLQQAAESAKKLAAEVLPASFTPMLSGEMEEMMEAFQSFFISLLLAVVIIYLILAAQFESFLYPLTIMMSLPLSLLGALGGLYLFGMTLNIYSLIGMILLMGLVTKNAILLVDCTNQLLAKGMTVEAALCEAGRLRLRPILMTVTSTILGIAPIAFSLGAGAESRRPLGVCVMGGLLSSTLLTLVVIPALYLALHRLKWRKKAPKAPHAPEHLSNQPV